MTDRATSVASAIHAAKGLQRIIDARRLFPGVLNEEGCLDAFRVFVEHLEQALPEVEAFRSVWLQYEKPHIENIAPPEYLQSVIALGCEIIAGDNSLSVAAIDERDLSRLVTDLVKDSVETIPERLRKSAAWLEDQLLFHCRFPHPPGNRQLLRPERFVFLLGIYLELYFQLLQIHGSAPIGFSPHPLLRYIENLRLRLRHCSEQIADEELTAAMDELLNIEFDFDSNAAWEEWTQPIIKRALRAFERAQAMQSVPPFELVDAESLFVNSTRKQIAWLNETTATEWKKLFQNIKRHAPKWTTQAASVPNTCFEYIREVETQLRELARAELDRQFGSDRWWKQLESFLGKHAYDAALKTMQQRGVNNTKDILHFTQLLDLSRLISGSEDQWRIFANRFSCRRKEFNTLMMPILKGRTEETYNRPEHLWPKIEKDRVKVACHDLLSKLTSK